MMLLEVCRVLTNSGNKYDKIEKLTKWIWIVTCETRSAANQIISSTMLKEKGFRAFIPKKRLFKKRIIRKILWDFPPEDIKNTINEENQGIKIVDVYRMKKTVR